MSERIQAASNASNAWTLSHTGFCNPLHHPIAAYDIPVDGIRSEVENEKPLIRSPNMFALLLMKINNICTKVRKSTGNIH